MSNTLFTTLGDAFGSAQQWLFEAAVQPLMFRFGGAGLIEDGYDATGWLLVGAIEIMLMVTVIRALERWRPVEPRTDSAAVRVDILYTLIHRLGLFRLALFFGIDPLWDALFGSMRLHGLPTWQLDQWLAPWWPGVSDTALFSLAVYLLVFDGLEYAIHRAQHRYRWWWSLHALHHSQRQMTLWSDNRNHLLDDLIHDSIVVVVARFIGIAPGQFIAAVACTELLQSLAHANARISFGRVFERVLVSPRFHRLHHAIAIGHESAGRGSLGGCNFAVLFPVWDLIFRSANFAPRYAPTGIRDQLAEEGGRDYGRGFWSQQRLGLMRLFGRR